MELHESIFAPILAQKLGDTTHISLLFRRVVQAAGSKEKAGDWLLKVAVERGARHYQRTYPEDLPPDDPTFTNEEIGVALCLGHLRDQPMYIRAAAQLLSSPKTDIPQLVRLAEMERCETVLHHIAAASARINSALEPWASVRRLLRKRRKAPEGVLPHWTRFVSMTGVTREGGPHTDWLTRDE
jgi:hypothetical protein